MQESEFWGMRPRSFFLKIRFFDLSQTRREIYAAELVRLQTFFLVNIQLSKKDKFKTPGDMWPFSHEIEAKKEAAAQVQIDPAAMKEKTEKILKLLNNEWASNRFKNTVWSRFKTI